ncbi:MAG: PEP-CTERM sorting domain-containing protein [Planctomycetes bacterium]|nr:PEP-CTERM sorting domain-containing protein [Planctomycetota bacterium]
MLRKSTICAKSAAVILVAVAVLALGQVLQAGTISIVDIPAVNSDTNSGIGNPALYTHALDFGTSGYTGTTTINGVPFTRYGIGTSSPSPYTGPNFTDAGSSGNLSSAGNANIPADGQMGVLLEKLWYDSLSKIQTLTLSGLTPGQAYSTRVYYRCWEPTYPADQQDNTLTFNGDGTPVSQVVSGNAPGAHYVKYDYIALGTTVTIKADNNLGGGKWGWHMYGVSNQIPEPSTLALLARGLIGLLCYAWRKRK